MSYISHELLVYPFAADISTFVDILRVKSHTDSPSMYTYALRGISKDSLKHTSVSLAYTNLTPMSTIAYEQREISVGVLSDCRLKQA